jgi:hypothetical protein
MSHFPRVVASRLPLPVAPFQGVGRSLYLFVGAVALLVMTLVTGIWQKNRIDGILLGIDRLENNRSALAAEIAQEEIAIAQLSSYDRIVPRAEKELGLVVLASEEHAYVPVPPLPRDPIEPLGGNFEQLAAALRGAADFVLPGTSTAKEKEED